MSTQKFSTTKAKDAKNACLSVQRETHEKFINFLDNVNKEFSLFKNTAKKITMNDLLSELICHLNEQTKANIFNKRISGRFKLLLWRKRYEELNGSTTDDEWSEIILSADFQKFRKQNQDCLSIK